MTTITLGRFTLEASVHHCYIRLPGIGEGCMSREFGKAWHWWGELTPSQRQG